ncbi:HlyD family type I secretion periplasmic adaptor subunit [Uliginosibacterium sp. 31-16]|uniref:HlyD family type I secretion periplasmic adaptor subunit n=1 Tax=Uliginosibacterium sp. 31-16 TaxID=3068315 RepID=UPI00273F5FE6|nr:HlyD family type I secretion periplasmic adaptor subunit [Uliginosibacterium sp. 31-16]MDP5241429.1 HlyD family type I secretion periplasmic adaptor subunit [Uliginosibacterium sp. 31-16]
MSPFARLSALYDCVMNYAERHEIHEETDFIADADWAIGEQRPRGARAALWTTGAALTGMLVWAAFAQLDEVTKGEGKVIPSRQIQVIQSLDGGIVSEILVQEGQQVQTGQLLLKIDPTRFVSNLKENRSEYLSLLAKAERLEALASGKVFIAPPEVLTEAPEIAEQERALFESARAELNASIGIAQQQLTQRGQELKEVRARRETALQGYDLTNQELEKTRPLARTGAISEVELLRLEREVSRYKGERDMSAAQITRIESAISEAQRKIQEVELSIRNKARNELSEVNNRLGRLTEGSVALADRVKQSEIRSPVNGTVKRLQVNTVGGVVLPAKDIIEIVPGDDALLLEAKVQPRDIAFLHPGQKALVKFTAYDFSVYGGLEGTLENISADSITDEKGNAFYLVKVRTTHPTIGDNKMPIIPGMTAEVDILTGKKSILSYLVKPVLRAHASALRER